MPAIYGFVSQLGGLKFSNSTPGKSSTATAMASLTVIARRSVHRAGTRHWRRGADPEGNVANFVESEQLLQLEPGAGEEAAEDEEVALPGIGRARKPKKPRARNVKGDAAPPNPLAGASADED
jgi:hypothetical protein